MKKLLLIAATLLMLAVSGCAPQVDVEADAAAVRSVFDEATAALNPGGGDIVDLDTEDAVVMYASEPAAIGKEAIRARQQIFDDQATAEETRSVEEVVVSGDWAFVRWTGTGAVTPKDGGESSEFNRKGITIFQRQADTSWKIARVIWNSNQRDVSECDQKTLYQRLGGYDVVAAILDITGPRVINDPELSKFFPETDEEMGKRGRQLAVNLLCELTGGPCFYTGPDMKMIHKGLGITDEHWQSFLGHLGETLDELNMDSDEKTAVIAVFAELKGDIVEQQEE